MTTQEEGAEQVWSPAALVLAVITIVIWASGFVVIRVAGSDYSAGALALGRQLTGSIALTAFVALRSVRRPGSLRLPRGRALLAALVWGAAWFGLYSVTVNASEQLVDAGTAALLVNLAPVLIGIFSGLFLGEGFPARLMIGIGVSFIGVVLISTSLGTANGTTLGVALGVAAAVIFAGSAIVQKKLLRVVDPLTLTWIGCIAGTLATLPFAPNLIQEATVASGTSTVGLLYLGTITTAVAFVTWGFALSRLPAGHLAASTYAIPVLVLILSSILLNEIPPALAILGGGLSLLGVAISTGLLRSARQRFLRRTHARLPETPPK